MKLTSALIGLAARGGVALSSGTASAMPVAPAQTSSVVVPAGYVCNEWGHCWHRHYWHRQYDGYGYGYYPPHYWADGAGATTTGITTGTGGIAGTTGTPATDVT